MTDAEQMRGPGQLPADEDEDLEDGEIESDEDEAPVPVPVVVPVKVPVKADPSPPKKVKSNRNVGDEQEDFATSLERQLAQALGKPAPASPSDDPKRSKDDRPKASEKSRKRKRRKDSPDRDRERDKNRKNKKTRPEESSTTTAPPDDMDDFEMMNVRGGSPPPPGALPTAALNSDGNDSDRSYSSYGSSYDSGDYHRRQRRRNRAADRNSRRENRRREREQERQRKSAASGAGGGASGGGRNEGGRHHRDHGNNDSDREQEAPPRGRDEYKNHPRKMELCKFYLMECCAKREKCLYMHQDFPCKYYYTSSECTQKDCKFGHGKPLTDALRAILMKHLETAPKEILGDFPRLGRELANQKIRSRHKELCLKFNVKDETAPQHNSHSHSNANGGGESSHIPANLPDLYSKPPPPIRGKGGGGSGPPQMDKGKKSRWCEQMRGNNNDGGRPMTGANAIPVTNNNNFAKVTAGPSPSSSSSSTLLMSDTAKNRMSLRNLTNVLTQDQIEKLSAIGIETLDQVKHLTVLQLTEIGLSIGQLSEIQTNAMQMEKMGPTGGSTPVPVAAAVVVAAPVERSPEPEPEKKIVPEVVAAIQSTVIIPTQQPPPPLVGDTDMRIVPTVNQDVDMRYLGPPPPLTAAATPAALSQPPPQLIKDVVRPRLTNREEIASPDASEERMGPNAVMDYSQYLKEANLVVATAAEEESKALEKEQKVTTAYGEDEEVEDDDDDDDSDDGLKICNDEEEEEEEEEGDDEEGDKEAKASDPAPPVIPSVSYWPMNLASLTSLNKIDLSASVTQMMNAEKKSEQPTTTIKPEAFVSMYNRTAEEVPAKDTSEPLAVQEPVVETVRAETQCRDSDSDTGSSKKQSLDPRDPRNRDPRNSREPPKSPPMIRQPQVVVRPSIYDRDEEEDEDSGSSRSPPLKPDMDMRIGDVDLRMPFKPMLQNYVPATEIDGSFSSHLPIVYKVFEWDVPKPNFKDIRRRVSPDNSQDPRLQRIFGLEGGDGNKPQQYGAEEAERSTVPNTDPRTTAASFDPRMDPRRRKEAATIQSPGGPGAPLATGLDIQLVLQKSSWYTDLGSKNKIFVNQQLAVLTSELKHFHEEVIISGPRPFDISRVFEQSPMLGNVLQQLGILVDEQGAIQPMGGAQHMGGVGGGVGLPPPNMNMNDPNMMMPELAVMIQQQQQQQQQQQRMFNMNPALMHQQMQGPPGLLGMAPPNLGFSGPPPFDGNGPPPPISGDMGNYMMNNSYGNGNGNDNMGGRGQQPPPHMGMGGGGGVFFQHQNNRGGFRNNNNNNNNNMGGRNDRWVHNNRGGGNDGRRHNSRRD